jgi:VWFA-related protein
VLKTLTRQTGGRAFTARNDQDVMQGFAQIAREIRSGYTIGFEPSDASGGFRSIRVVVRTSPDDELVARTRAGYYARSSP